MVQWHVVLLHDCVGDVRSELHIVDVLLTSGEVQQPHGDLELVSAPSAGRIDGLTHARRAIESNADILAHQLPIDELILRRLNLGDVITEVL